MLELCIVGGRIDRDAHLAEEGRVKNALMRLTVAGHKTGAVDGEDDVLPQQVHIVDDLVVGALQEGGVDADHRQHPLAGKACRKGDSVLLSHAHIKKAVAVGVGEELQACAVLHGSGDGADLSVRIPLFVQQIAEDRREGLLGSHFGVRDALDQIKGGHAVEIAGIVLGGGIALALLGHDVQETGSLLAADVAQHPLQLRLIVAVHGSKIVEPHILEHGRVVHRPAQDALAALDGIFEGDTHHGHAIQEGAHIFFCIQIAVGGAQMVQIPSQRAHIFADGHFVVVEDHQQVIQPADVVHAFIDHAAREGTVADDGDDMARLAPQLFGPCHADGQRKSCVAVARDESVVLALIGVRKAGKAIQLAELIKPLPAARQQFMGVTLVADIKNDLVFGGLQHPVQGNGQLHCAQIGGQVAARFRHMVQQKAPDLGTQLPDLLIRQIFQIAGL